MRKRILTIFLALILCLSSMTAMAVKRPEGVQPEINTGETDGNREYKVGDNILAGFGSFDIEEAVGLMTPKGAELTWRPESALGTGGSMYIDADAYGFGFIEVPCIVGETYTIKFYAKAAEPASIRFIPMIGTSGHFDADILQNGSVTTEWKEFTVEYYCDGKRHDGTEDTRDLRMFNTRYGKDGIQQKYYLDEIQIIPHGDVEYDWNTWIKNKATIANGEELLSLGIDDELPRTVVTFDDTKNHWAEKSIELLASAGYINGLGDGTYAPNANVTRAEFIKMATGIFRLEPSKYEGGYTDVKAEDWFANDIQTALDIKLIPDVMKNGAEFNPNQAITREEAAAILAKVGSYRNAPASEVSAFADDAKISNWARQGIHEAVSYGLIKGYPDGTFVPKANITRAEAAQMLFRVVEITDRLAVYVDGENGDDNNPGTQDAPVATLDGARKTVQPYLKNMKNHIFVYIKAGNYYLEKDVQFTDADSGQNGYNVFYTSLTDEEPLFTMGKEYSNFTLHDAQKGIYKTYVGFGTQTRQVYINGVRGLRAYNYWSENNNLKNMTLDATKGIYECTNTEFLELSNPEMVEFVYMERWVPHNILMDHVEDIGNGRVRIYMNEKQWKNAYTFSGCEPSNPIYVENAYEFLNSPGEWYLNPKDGYLYYKPRDFEDPATMVATIPVGERALTVTGTSSTKKVHHITFDNLAFKYCGWIEPSDPTSLVATRPHQGFIPTGAETSEGLTKGKEEFALVVADAAYVDFTNCTIGKMGGGGLAYLEIFQNCDIIGNHIYEMAGTGITLGSQAPEESQFNKYFMPSDPQMFRIYNRIEQNLMYDIALQYHNAAGINASHGLKETTIMNNEIYNTYYSAMHIGWGWASYAKSGTGTYHLRADRNYLHETVVSYIYDGGPIYTLGATSPDAVTGGPSNSASYNYYEGQRNACAGVYPDDGSTYWDMSHNVQDLSDSKYWPLKNVSNWPVRWMHNHAQNVFNCTFIGNYATTDHEQYESAPDANVYEKPMVYPDANWPQEALDIIDAAGLQGEYEANAPDDIQRLYIRNKSTEDAIYVHEGGEPFRLDVVAYRRKKQLYEIPYSELIFYSTDDSVATVDKNGYIHAQGAGECNIVVEYLDGDTIRRQYVDVVSNDFIQDVSVNASEFNMLLGFATDIVVKAKTMSGKEVELAETTFTSDDESIAVVSNSGAITTIKEGSTTVHGTFKATDGQVFTRSFKVSVISYVNDETPKFLETSRKIKSGDLFLQKAQWTRGSTQISNECLQLAADNPTYTTSVSNNEIVSFDMVINDPNTWPSLALRNLYPMEDYQTSNTYLIGFKPDIIELQRFNMGKRTMIFGDETFTPIGGDGYPNILPNGEQMFEYGKRYSITVGTLSQEEGTRIILIVNNKPVFDFVDKAEGYLADGSYFGVYALQGNFQLLPYSGLEFTEEQLTTALSEE